MAGRLSASSESLSNLKIRAIVEGETPSVLFRSPPQKLSKTLNDPIICWVMASRLFANYRMPMISDRPSPNTILVAKLSRGQERDTETQERRYGSSMADFYSSPLLLLPGAKHCNGQILRHARYVMHCTRPEDSSSLCRLNSSTLVLISECYAIGMH
jgi:hypothetical protein